MCNSCSDSRPVRDWVETENLLPDYLLESGGAVNPDVEMEALACLSDGYYAYTREARPVPEALTHDRRHRRHRRASRSRTLWSH